MNTQYGTRPELSRLRGDIAFLQQPFSWPRALRAGCEIGRTGMLGRLVQTLSDNGRLAELPPSIDRWHAYFWLRAGSAHGPMTWPRFALGSLHAGMAALACALLVAVVGYLGGSGPGHPPVPSDEALSTAMYAFGATIAVVVGAWLLIAAAIAFDQWQGLPESAPTRWPWLRRLAIAALCALGLVPYELGATPYSGWLVAASFLFAVRKFRRRTTANMHLLRLVASMPVIIYASLSLSMLSRMQDISEFPFVPAAAFATLAILALDLWRYRAHLHRKPARG
jgi:hypothetical protein